LKKNCWEFMGCRRSPDEQAATGIEPCPAALDKKLDGTHGGINAGRACWVLAGTYCGGKPQGSFAQKFPDCSLCDFYKLVREEEGFKFVPTSALVMRFEAKETEEQENSE
jgi:hypothetical protein